MQARARLLFLYLEMNWAEEQDHFLIRGLNTCLLLNRNDPQAGINLSEAGHCSPGVRK